MTLNDSSLLLHLVLFHFFMAEYYSIVGEGSGNPLQYSCLENSMDRGAMGLQSVGHD